MERKEERKIERKEGVKDEAKISGLHNWEKEDMPFAERKQPGAEQVESGSGTEFGSGKDERPAGPCSGSKRQCGLEGRNLHLAIQLGTITVEMVRRAKGPGKQS